MRAGQLQSPKTHVQDLYKGFPFTFLRGGRSLDRAESSHLRMLAPHPDTHDARLGISGYPLVAGLKTSLIADAALEDHGL